MGHQYSIAAAATCTLATCDGAPGLLEPDVSSDFCGVLQPRAVSAITRTGYHFRCIIMCSFLSWLLFSRSSSPR
jgi:hypothetical protein